MMEFTVLALILLLRVVQSVCGKSTSNYMPTDKYGIITYLSLRMGISAVGAAVLFLISGNIIMSFSSFSVYGYFISAATGLTIALSTFCSLLAMRGASVVLCSLFSSAGLLVPTVFGIFMYGQGVSLGQWFGILCLFAAAVLLSSSSNKTNGKITFKTVLLLIGSMLSNGTTMLLQTVFKNYVPNGNVSLYSFLQFIIPAILLFLVAGGGSVKNKMSLPKMNGKLMIYTVFAALSVLGISQISTIASSFIPVAVLFPISDGGHTVVAAIVAAIMFKERFTIKSTFGILIGISGIILIKLLAL